MSISKIAKRIISAFLAAAAIVPVCSCSVAHEIVTDIESPSVYGKIYASDYGMSVENADNSQALQAAFDYLSAHPSTTLSIDNGVYYLSPEAQILLRNTSDIVIEGNGAELYFSNGLYFRIDGCERVEFRDITVDWDEKGGRLASVIRIDRVVSGNEFEVTFPECQTVPSDPWLTLNPLDPDSLTPGCGSYSEIHLPSGWSETGMKIESLGDGRATVTHDGTLGGVVEGLYYLLRHKTYCSGVFYLNNSRNFTADGVKIYGAYGVAVCTTGVSGDLAFLNMTVGLRPGTENKRRISTSADCFHLSNTTGNILIDGCDISFTGDDCVNINTHIGSINAINGSTVTVECPDTALFATGDEVYFLTKSYKNPGITAVITDIEALGGNLYRITLDSLPGSFRGAYICPVKYDGSGYVIQNSVFHECRARGLLLQADNGVVKNCRFYKTQGCAILICSDVCDLWMEGTGVNNLTVYGNTFEDCDVSGWGGVIRAHTMLYGSPSSTYAFTDIVIKNNTFIGNDATYFADRADVIFTDNRTEN